jgi:hypothetical protein
MKNLISLGELSSTPRGRNETPDEAASDYKREEEGTLI